MTELRSTFDSAAERYHHARPDYPPELFDDLVQLTGVDVHSRILEIGPGTGKATLPLAERGLNIHAIELGAELATQARQNLTTFPRVSIEVGEFESTPIAPTGYDVVMSATAFHWVRQPEGYVKVAGSLKSGGYFVEFRHHHVWSPESDAFYNASQEVYRKYDPDTPDDHQLPMPDDVPTLESAIMASGLFERPTTRRYIQNVVHTPESYSELLWTFSGHIAMPEPNRSLLINGVADVIRKLTGQRAVKTHLVFLHVARVLPQHR